MRVSLLNSHNFCFSCKAVGAADQSQSSSLFFAALVSHTRPPLLSFLLLPPPALFSPCLLLSPSLLHPLLASSHEVRFANQGFSIISCVFHSLKVTMEDAAIAHHRVYILSMMPQASPANVLFAQDDKTQL